MEGPTPVSALISRRDDGHRGRVHGGAFARNFPECSVAMQFVAVIGCVTALFAATIGLVQTDIKKVLAYSTSRNSATCFWRAAWELSAPACFT